MIDSKKESTIKILKNTINPCKIFYFTLKDEQRRLEKLLFISNNPLKTIDFTQIIPDRKGNWLNQTENDFEDLRKEVGRIHVAGEATNIRYHGTVHGAFNSGTREAIKILNF